MKAIVYTSNSGHTEQYAALLSEAIGLEAVNLKDAPSKLKQGDEIIYMGWLMAGSVAGYKKAARRYSVKAVCGVGMSDQSQTEDMRKANHLPSDLPVFYLQGGFEMEKLHGGIYRLMMKTMSVAITKDLQKKQILTDSDREMLAMAENGKNTVAADKLSEVIAWYRQGC